MKYLAGPWPHVSLTSVIDILLVAVIIYELLALIKGTRASLMLVGVAALALAFYLSRFGQLTTLNWLISTLLPYTVFALIVVFAAEIRQALTRLGRKLLKLSGGPRRKTPTMTSCSPPTCSVRTRRAR